MRPSSHAIALPRRRVLWLLSALGLAGFAPLRRAWSANSTETGSGASVPIAFFDDHGRLQSRRVVPKIVKSRAEWRRQLSQNAYLVTREDGTERPFTGQYVHKAGAGVYRCIGCDTALFQADTQFDSGTGWPSFWAPIAPENVRESEDHSFGAQRVAVSCARCDAHLGHVFPDGPKPTGLRYCMNSVALRFAARPAATAGAV